MQQHRLADRQTGFTMIELVTVIVIIGILAAVAGPRFFTTSVFQARGYAGEVQSAIGYAQKLAIASGCSIRVEIDAAGYRIARWTNISNCNDRTAATALIARPGGGSFNSTTPGGLAVTGTLFYFDRVGRPRNPATGAAITSSAALQAVIAGTTIQVEPETGYVRDL